MHKLFLLIVPFSIAAVTINYVEETDQQPTREVEVIRSKRSQEVSNQPYTNQQPQRVYRSYNEPPGTFRENTSQDAWHNQPNNESYYDNPNWPNVKR
ncbi:MAG: hypothetical protein KDK62_00555 [Chlamydiia bacterium]|nr:hypothetical protein [Chlamydiia bacterium]